MERINARSAEACAAGVPTATVRQVYRGPVARTMVHLFGKGRGNPGSTGLGLYRGLDTEADADFVKSRLDGFSNPAFEAWLAENQVGELEIVGLDGCHCIRATALGALNRGFDVHLDDDLILASDPATWNAHRAQLREAGATTAPH